MFQFLRSRSSLFAAFTFTLLTACGGGGGGITPPAAPPTPIYLLALTIVGTGQVQSQPSGVACAATCTPEIAAQTVLTLTATPATGQIFSGWAGACSGAQNTCVVTMDQARSATATFTPTGNASSYTLSVSITGNGTVASQPAGINCGAVCSFAYLADTLVTLTATPAANQNFTAWSGACTGSASSCTVTMNQARTVGASFETIVGSNFALNASISGNGAVVSNPAGISCGSICSASFAAGTAVTLTATPGAGQIFSSWSGSCAGTQTSCTLQMTQIRSAQAVFSAIPVIAWQPAQLLESSNDFNIAGSQIAVNRNGDAIAIWEQSDGVPNGSTLKVFSRRYQMTTGWQSAVEIAGLTRVDSNPSLITGGQLLMDDAGVATWIREDLQTRRNTPSNGWGAAFSPSNPRVSQKLTSAVMDASGNIGVMRSGSDVENSALAVGGVWGTWALVDNAGSAISQRAKVALSSNGTALAVWRERVTQAIATTA